MWRPTLSKKDKTKKDKFMIMTVLDKNVAYTGRDEGQMWKSVGKSHMMEDVLVFATSALILTIFRVNKISSLLYSLRISRRCAAPHTVNAMFLLGAPVLPPADCLLIGACNPTLWLFHLLRSASSTLAHRALDPGLVPRNAGSGWHWSHQIPPHTRHRRRRCWSVALHCKRSTTR